MLRRFLQQQGESAAPMWGSCAARLVQPQSWLPRDVPAASQPLYVQAEPRYFGHLSEVSFLFQMQQLQIDTQRLRPVQGKGADLLEICLKFLWGHDVIFTCCYRSSSYWHIGSNGSDTVEQLVLEMFLLKSVLTSLPCTTTYTTGFDVCLSSPF